MQVYPRAEAAGGRKAPRHEVAGSWALAGQRALWGFDVGAELEDGCDAGRMQPAESAYWESEACDGRFGKRWERINELTARRAR